MRWLRIGMGVKRYVVGIMAGTVLVGLAIAMVLATVYRTVDFPESTSAAVGAVTLQWIAHPVREIIVGAIGFCIMAGSVFLLFRSVISVVIAPGEDVAEMVYRGRLLRRGPQVVSIGGGTGQGVLLRGLKERTANITAVVTVADDGGSSGRLRKEFQLMPPGDLRNCPGLAGRFGSPDDETARLPLPARRRAAGPQSGESPHRRDARHRRRRGAAGLRACPRSCESTAA